MRYEEFTIEGRNAVMEAFRSGKTIDRLFVLDGCQDGPVKSITREARKGDTIITFVKKERLDQLSETGKHQGVIAYAAAYEYAEVDDILKAAQEKGEPPFIILLDNIEDPHNLGAIIRTAHQAGAHGVIIPKRRAVGLTATVAKTSAGAINYLPVAKVTNLSVTIAELKEKGLWFVCADMDGELMYQLDKLDQQNNWELGRTARFLQLLSLFDNRRESDIKSRDTMPGELQQMLDYINDHFREIQHIREIYNLFYISPSNINRLFRKYIHLSPREFLEAKKLACAQQLLMSGLTVTQVCLQCGFSDCSHFISIFKKNLVKHLISLKRTTKPIINNRSNKVISRS
jgi:23S rRNA (guanosine2251-2'-O)-methyltransferase